VALPEAIRRVAHRRPVPLELAEGLPLALRKLFPEILKGMPGASGKSAARFPAERLLALKVATDRLYREYDRYCQESLREMLASSRLFFSLTSRVHVSLRRRELKPAILGRGDASYRYLRAWAAREGMGAPGETSYRRLALGIIDGNAEAFKGGGWHSEKPELFAALEVYVRGLAASREALGRSGQDREDMVQAAFVGALDAIAAHSPSAGSLSALIRNRALRSIEADGRGVGLGRSIQYRDRQANKLKDVAESLGIDPLDPGLGPGALASLRDAYNSRGGLKPIDLKDVGSLLANLANRAKGPPGAVTVGLDDIPASELPAAGEPLSGILEESPLWVLPFALRKATGIALECLSGFYAEGPWADSYQGIIAALRSFLDERGVAALFGRLAPGRRFGKGPMALGKLAGALGGSATRVGSRRKEITSSLTSIVREAKMALGAELEDDAPDFRLGEERLQGRIEGIVRSISGKYSPLGLWDCPPGGRLWPLGEEGEFSFSDFRKLRTSYESVTWFGPDNAFNSILEVLKYIPLADEDMRWPRQV
jgi:hypothetical protein